MTNLARLTQQPALTLDTLPALMRRYTGTLADVTCDRAIAGAILAYNTRNRAMRRNRVETFIRILEQKRWINTGEPIIMTRTTLNEGQHRLEAINRSGISAPLDLRFGIGDNAFEVTGSGATRTPADTLSILGVPSHFAIAAMLKILMFYDGEILPTSRVRFQSGGDEVLAAWQRWPDAIQAFHMMQNTVGARPNRLYSASASAFAYLAMRQKNSGQVQDFLFAVATGVVNHIQDPARLLRERLMNDKTLLHHTYQAVVMRFALYILAWNAWVNGERPKVLVWHPQMPFPRVPGVVL